MQQPLSLFSRLEERDLIAEWGDTYVIHFSGSLRQHAYCIYKIIKKKQKTGKKCYKKVYGVCDSQDSIWLSIIPCSCRKPTARLSKPQAHVGNDMISSVLCFVCMLQEKYPNFYTPI